MPASPCPRCHALPTRRLEEISKDAWVSYYRCDLCGCVWTFPKGEELTAGPTVLTQPNAELVP